MTERANALLKQAMALAEAERAEIAGALLESLEPSSDTGVDEAWSEEVRRRLTQLDAGSAELIPWEEVREQLFARLNARTLGSAILARRAARSRTPLNGTWPAVARLPRPSCGSLNTQPYS
jgi:putative addiction module component (TIGR02574 family)